MVDTAERISDSRGEIINIAAGEFKAVQVITSKAGTTRSNHYHKTGAHRLYVLSGKMIYREREFRGWTVKEFIVNPGQSIWTAPMTLHDVFFPVDTVLVSCATGNLDHETYEADTVRVQMEHRA